MKLTFIILKIDDENNPQDGLFFSDNNAATFKQVLRFYPENWCSSCGSYPPINVDSLAHEAGLNLTDQFVIRFQQYDNADFFDGFNQGDADGIYLDEFNVTGNTVSITGYIKDSGLNLFPNPSRSNINIVSRQEINSLEILDLAGKPITTFKFDNHQLDISRLPIGIYLLKIKLDNGIFIERIIKE